MGTSRGGGALASGIIVIVIVLGIGSLSLAALPTISAAVSPCPGSPLVLTTPDSDTLDKLLSLWSQYEPCGGRVVFTAPGIYRLVSEASGLDRNA